MSLPNLTPDTRQALAALRERVRQIEGVPGKDSRPAVSTGCEGLDPVLPAGGLARGTLLECFPTGQNPAGNGGGTLAMLLAKAAAAEGGAVVLDRDKTFYPLAAVALGIPWRQLLLVRPKNAQDELWALDQALRSRSLSGYPTSSGK